MRHAAPSSQNGGDGSLDEGRADDDNDAAAAAGGEADAASTGGGRGRRRDDDADAAVASTAIVACRGSGHLPTVRCAPSPPLRPHPVAALPSSRPTFVVIVVAIAVAVVVVVVVIVVVVVVASDGDEGDLLGTIGSRGGDRSERVSSPPPTSMAEAAAAACPKRLASG